MIDEIDQWTILVSGAILRLRKACDLDVSCNLNCPECGFGKCIRILAGAVAEENSAYVAGLEKRHHE